MLTPVDQAPPLAAVHVDLDGARHIYRIHGWPYDYSDDPLFETGLAAALDLFARQKIRATLFVIAEDVDDPAKRRLLEQAVAAGHEIASHSITHRILTRLSRDEVANEIGESRRRLTEALKADVLGFRAPAFQVNAECLEAIRDAGYRYDSSRLAGGRASQARPHQALAGSGLIELPVPSLPGVGLPFHPSYSLIVGDWYFRRGVAAFRQRLAPFILLFHLTDFAEPLNSHRVRHWRQRLFTLSHLPARRKRTSCAAALNLVTRQFQLATTSSLANIRLGTAGAAQELVS